MAELSTRSPVEEVHALFAAIDWRIRPAREIAERAELDIPGRRLGGHLRRLKGAGLITYYRPRIRADGYALTTAGEAAQRLLRGEMP